MPFSFKKRESMIKAVRRLCCERIDKALENLTGRDRLKSVHNIRKEIKKLRAILRLVRGKISKGVYRKNTKALRKAANRLTVIRDTHVKLSAFEKLLPYFAQRLLTGPFPKIKRALSENCREEERRFLKDDSVSEVKRILRKMKRNADDLKIRSDGWTAICPGLKESYCRGQEAYKAALEESSAENFHEWRKRVKDLYYQIRLLCPIWPQEMCAAADELEALSEYIGDDHDLVMLKEFVTDRFKSMKEVNWLTELIYSRQNELRSAALKLGARFYSEKPSLFCKRTGSYWKNWRGEK
jgi:CHAD domain-containing protein